VGLNAKFFAFAPRAGCKLPTKTTSTNDEALGNLGTRRDGGREGEVVLRVGGSAVATEGVLRTMSPRVSHPPDGGVVEKPLRAPV